MEYARFHVFLPLFDTIYLSGRGSLPLKFRTAPEDLKKIAGSSPLMVAHKSCKICLFIIGTPHIRGFSAGYPAVGASVFSPGWGEQPGEFLYASKSLIGKTQTRICTFRCLRKSVLLCRLSSFYFSVSLDKPHRGENKTFLCLPINPHICAQPFKEPTMMPFTKYFCRKGYRTSIGTVETTMEEYLISCACLRISSIAMASAPEGLT